MRFLIHGAVRPEALAALARHEHVCHTILELSGAGNEPPGDDSDLLPESLFERLTTKQWHLVTTDAALVREFYEKKLHFAGIIVLILDDPEALHDQGKAVDRLFDRYQRLTPGRLYTITPSRVKIRQLPDANV